MYIKKSSHVSGGFGSKVKIATCQVFVTPPYICWQLAFYRHLPTSGRQNTIKTAPQPLYDIHIWKTMAASYKLAYQEIISVRAA